MYTGPDPLLGRNGIRGVKPINLCQFTQTTNLAHFLQVQHFWKLKQNKENPPHKTIASDLTTAYCSKSHTEQQAVSTEYCF